MSSSSPKEVYIFWDFGSCPAPIDSSGYAIVNKIRSLALRLGPIKSFKAYLPVSDHNSLTFNGRALTLRSELQSSGVSLTDAPGGKEVADKMLIVDMLTHAFEDMGPESSNVIMLISADDQFAYALSTLRMRNRQILLLGTGFEDTSAVLASQGDLCLDWETEVMGGFPVAPWYRDSSGKPQTEDSPVETPTARSSSEGIAGIRTRFVSQVDDDDAKSSLLHPSSSRSVSEIESLEPRISVQLPILKEASMQTDAPLPVPQTPSYRKEALPVKVSSNDSTYSSRDEVASTFAPSEADTSPPEVVPPKAKQWQPTVVPNSGSETSEKARPPSQPWNKEPEQRSTLEDWSRAKPFVPRSTSALSSTNGIGAPPEYSSTIPPATPSSFPQPLKPKSEPPSTATGIPPEFLPLVEIMRASKANGVLRPLWGTIAFELITAYPTAYAKAGVTRFAQYSALAAEKKIVELGGIVGSQWIRLLVP